MDLNALLVQLTFLATIGKLWAFAFVEQDERKCKYTRVDKMVKIRCFDMNLKEVPQYLKTSVEILDLSYNRIRKLKRSSFQNYKSIKYLLLYENMIQSVEVGTFENLKDLQEIDLSNNGLSTIPGEILQLPSLRNLYVDSNELINLESDLEVLSKPIRAPLEYLNVADCGLQDIPDLGVLPKLWHLNASSNPLQEISLSRFANMCNLKSVDFIKTDLNQCACQQINNHLRFLEVKTKFVPICMETLSLDVCPLPFNQTVNSPTFQSCKTAVTYAEAKSRWILAAGCVGGVVLLLLIIWCCMHRRRKKRKSKTRIRRDRDRVVCPKNGFINSKQYNNEDYKDSLDKDDNLNHKSYNQNNDALLRCDTA